MIREETFPKVTKIPGKNARRWANFHLKYASKSTYEPDFVWDRTATAIGPFCTDVDGNVVIDFVSNIGSSPLGYNNPEIIDLLRTIKNLDPDRYAGTDFIAGYGKTPKDSEIPTPSHLHRKVIEITKQFGFDCAFFSNSGAEAVENAIKVCYDYRKNYGYGICFDGAFHGRTLGTLSLNRSKKIQTDLFPAIPKIYSIPFASRSKVYKGLNIVTLKELLEKNGKINPKEVAYIIIEPIQGEDGFNFPKKDFIREVYEVAHKHNIPIISDEVQSGMGRTGKWWAIENFKCKPDIISSAKALRIGATIGKRKFFPKQNERISSTWGEGNAIASAVGYKTIEIMQKRNLLRNAEINGKYFVKRLKELEDKYKFILDADGIGLMDRIEIDSVKRRDLIIKNALKQGLLLAGAGEKSIRFLPPLDVTKREIDIACEVLDNSLRRCR